MSEEMTPNRRHYQNRSSSANRDRNNKGELVPIYGCSSLEKSLNNSRQSSQIDRKLTRSPDQTSGSVGRSTENNDIIDQELENLKKIK